jgi:hypothetical protein
LNERTLSGLFTCSFKSTLPLPARESMENLEMLPSELDCH